MKKVRFTSHAEEKLEILTASGCRIEIQTILNILESPPLIVEGHHGRRIGQGELDSSHVLRVVFEEYEQEIVVVTFYPGRKSRYER